MWKNSALAQKKPTVWQAIYELLCLYVYGED